jgi:asparagine synthase (glutamine-hydrolysing)
MCGFAGYIDLRAERMADRDLLVRMTDKLIHRGPDSAGLFVENEVGLGFRRLSIVDLITGDQPNYNEDGSVVLLCNGEIYNFPALRRELEERGHVFSTNSDVEVLVHLYEESGCDFLPRLNGQFAFVVYDRVRKLLFLGRDQFGVVPLYYTTVSGLFLFASEIKALLEHPAVPREVDLTGLDQVLCFPGVVSPRALFKGIASLSSGHRLVVHGSQVEISEYWDLDDPVEGELSGDRPEEHYRERLRELLEQAVRHRLQADVPVGFYLSGGLDSSLVAALAHHIRGEGQHTFSISFTEPSINEARYQQKMAERLRSRHHQILFDWSEIADRLVDMVYHCVCPVRESYNTCSLALSAAAKYILKRLAGDLLPAEIINREKFGFRAPGTPFLLRQNIEWIEDHISSERIRRQGYFNPETVQTLRQRNLEDGSDFNPHLEMDFLMVVLTFSVMCDLFGLPALG